MSEPIPNLPAPPTLNYVQRSRFGWIGRHRRGLIIFAVLIATAGPVWWNWQALKRRVLWLYWSHRAAVHVTPAAIAPSIRGPEATLLANTNPDYVLQPPISITSQPTAWYVPLAFRELARIDGRLRSMNTPDGPVLFMGTLLRPDGVPRLVIITGSSEYDSRYLLRSIGVAVLPHPGWFDPLPPATGTPLTGIFLYNGPPPKPASYRTAAADPKDPPHVVIQYTVTAIDTLTIGGGFHGAASQPVTLVIHAHPPPELIGPGEIDAYLQNDDSLRFALRGPGQLVRSVSSQASK